MQREDESALFLAIVKQHYPSEEDLELHWCWEYLVRGVAYGWLRPEELQQAMAALLRHHGWGVEGLQFDFEGWRNDQDTFSLLGVSLFGEVSTCNPEDMTDRMATVLRAYEVARAEYV